MEIRVPDEPEKCRDVLQGAVQILKDWGSYSQRDIARKASALNTSYNLPEPTLTTLLKRERAVRWNTLRDATKHILQVLYEECGMVFDAAQDRFIEQKGKDWEQRIVQDNPLQGFEFYPEGRLSVPEKIELIGTAKKEIIEVGIRLHTFAVDFVKTNDALYKAKIEALLKKGIHFKSYMLDPNHSIAGHYFDDRAKILNKEKLAKEEAKQALEGLKNIAAEFKDKGYKGRFELYLYQHYPQNLFISIDRGDQGARMLVSPYLYGIRRAECPVFVVSNSTQPTLYRKYKQSLEAIIQDAIIVKI